MTARSRPRRCRWRVTKRFRNCSGRFPPSRVPITSGAVTKGGRQRGPTKGSAQSGPHKVVRQSGPHSPLCGSESGGAPSAPVEHAKAAAKWKCGSDSGDAPSAQGTVRTTFADIAGALCGSESGGAPSAPVEHAKAAAKWKCGSDSGGAPSAQGTVRTTYADIPGVLARGEDTAGGCGRTPWAPAIAGGAAAA